MIPDLKLDLLSVTFLQNLRDPQGNLYSQTEYNLQQSADGGVHLLRRHENRNTNPVNVQMLPPQQQPNQQQQPQTNSTQHISHHHHNPHH